MVFVSESNWHMPLAPAGPPGASAAHPTEHRTMKGTGQKDEAAQRYTHWNDHDFCVSRFLSFPLGFVFAACGWRCCRVNGARWSVDDAALRCDAMRRVSPVRVLVAFCAPFAAVCVIPLNMSPVSMRCDAI